MTGLLGFYRWMAYDLEDATILKKTQQDSILKWLKEEQAKGINPMDAAKDQEKIKHVFKGHLPPCDLQVELKTWLTIKQ